MSAGGILASTEQAEVERLRPAAMTGTPAAADVRASPNPVGPASYAAATGPCCSAITATHRATASLPGGTFASMTSPVDVSNAAARTLRACTSEPIAVR